jgi:hypothetical protein
MRHRAVLLILLLVIPTYHRLHAQSSAAPLSVPMVVERAATYIERFHKALGSVVAEERYEQTVRPGTGRDPAPFAPRHSVLRSDFLLVTLENGLWLPFRDVFEHDGKAVRDRQDRLTKLFLNGTTANALEQARRLMVESARYNLGIGTREMNIPTLPLMFLDRIRLSQVAFTDSKPDSAAPGRVIAFNEVGRPTVVQTSGDRDLPAQGRLWIDEDTGTVNRGEVVLTNTELASEIVVTFEASSLLGVSVPMRMEERFRRRRDAYEVRGVATYSNLRRFTVSTSESIPVDLPQ